MERLQGAGYYVPHEPDERNRDFVLAHLYGKQTLPLLSAAAARLDREQQSASGEAARVLERQRDHIRLAYLYQRSSCNWFEAGRYIVPGKNPGPGRPIGQIVDDEIQVTRDLIALLEGRADQFVILVPLGDCMMYTHGLGFVPKLQQRIAIMQAHRHDPARDIGAGLRQMRDHLDGISE
jgi:hypothetical protein